MDRSKLSSVKDTKETLIEYFELHKNLGFFNDGTYSNITKSSILDPAAIKADGGFQAFAYFDTNPNCFYARVKEDEKERLKYENLATALHETAGLAVAVEGLVDEELKESSLAPKDWKGKNLSTKAHVLARYRIDQQTTRLRRPRDYKTNLRKYEFVAQLYMLHYGYGNILDNTTLYFDYRTSFADFVEILRQQTVLCTIPPLPLDVLPTAAYSDDSLAPETSRTLCHESPIRDTSKVLSMLGMHEGAGQETMDTPDTHEEPSQATSKTLSIREGLSSNVILIAQEEIPSPVLSDGASQETVDTPTMDKEPSQATSKIVSMHDEPMSIGTPIAQGEFPSTMATDLVNNTLPPNAPYLPKGPDATDGSSEQDSSTFVTPEQPFTSNSPPTCDEQEYSTNSIPSGFQDDHAPLAPSHVNTLDHGGYTLEHGSWQYKIISRKTSGHYSSIETRGDYMRMLDKLKAMGSTGSTRSTVVIFHALDREARSKWQAQKQAEQMETARLNDTFGSSEEEDFFEENMGESYWDWYCRTKQGFVGTQTSKTSPPRGYSLSSSPNREQSS